MSTFKKKKNSVVTDVSQTPQPSSCANDKGGSCLQDFLSWSNIPAIALRKIYQSLDDRDRASMARVCRSWNQGFRDPTLWREMCIWFCGRRTKKYFKKEAYLAYETDLPSATENIAIEFLKAFPTSLRYVEIIFPRVSPRTAKEMARNFNTLATSLKGATLRNLSIYELKVLWKIEQLREKLIDSVERLLQNQRSLRLCHMESARFDIDNGIKILKCLSESSGNTIEDLSLEQYFRKGNVVSCDAWQALVGSHPNLLVNLHALRIKNTKETLPILSPAMPVYKLEWDVWMDAITSEFELTNLLHRVARYHRTIKLLKMGFLGDFPNLDLISVQNMLSKCKNLLTFTCNYVPPDYEYMAPGIWSLSTDSF